MLIMCTCLQCFPLEGPAIQVLRNADGVMGGVTFSGKKHYEGVRFNVISVTRGWVGSNFLKKKRYVILEWL